MMFFHADIQSGGRWNKVSVRRTVVMTYDEGYIDVATGEIMNSNRVKLDHPATADEAAECTWKAQGVK